MSKSVFYRYFIMVQSILLIAMLCASVFSFIFLGRHVIEAESASLENSVQRLAAMTSLSLENADSNNEYFLVLGVRSISNFSECTVTIMDNDGAIYMEERFDNAGMSARDLDPSITSGILSGDEYRHVGKLEKSGGQLMMVLSAPVKYKNESVGAVVAIVPMPQLQKARKELMVTLIWIYLISMLLASAVSFFMARHVAKPLRQMSHAAKEISDGNFEMRVDEHGVGELGELSRSFNSMTESLENLEHMRSSFISNVSHELRTPMTTISGFVEGILDGTVPQEKEKEYLAIVRDESKRLSKLVTVLLQTSRLEQGKELEMQTFDWVEHLRTGIIQFEQVLTEKQLTVTANFPADSMEVVGHPDALYQVITNLLDNATKFTPEKGAITVDVKKKGSLVYTAITNSGDGIPPEDLPLIWDRFYKGDASRSEDKSGVGLGLYLIRTILKHHGQSIWVESIPGEYTTFTFTLKAAD